MQIAKLAALASFLATSAYAHSWMECVSTQVNNYDAAKADPTLDVDQTCIGWARGKNFPENWIWESSNYVWNLDSASNDGYTCNPLQRSANYTAEGPMTRARPGETIRMRYWGNGHSEWGAGSPLHRDPGLVRIFWAGQAGVELSLKSNLTKANWLPGAQANFSADAIIEPLTWPTLDEKANYINVTLPDKIENGVHMMVWGWAWVKSLTSNPSGWTSDQFNEEWRDLYTTCFDIEIYDSDFVGVNPTVAAAQAAYNSTSDESSACTQTCERGGMASSICDGSTEDCPPCWYTDAVTSAVSCYDYSAGTTTCPFGGAYNCKTNTYDRRSLRFDHAPM
ncbi:hypothetical protein RUND412_005870 [Rhizina undulata]